MENAKCYAPQILVGTEGLPREQWLEYRRKGIGVKNVNDRLKIYFGEEYGITIESELDVGTTVTIKIPKIEKGQENEY